MSLLGTCSNLRPTHLGSRGGRCIVADSGCIRHCCTRTMTTNTCHADNSLRLIHRRSRYHHRISNPAGRIDRFCKRTPSRPNRSHSGSLVRRSRRHSRELGRTAIRREYKRRYGSCTRSDLDDKSLTRRLPCLRPRGRRSRAAVAPPPARDALAVLALELRHRALAAAFAVSFVGAVVAVVSSVAETRRPNTVAVACALELVCQARVRCSSNMNAVGDGSAESAKEDQRKQQGCRNGRHDGTGPSDDWCSK